MSREFVKDIMKKLSPEETYYYHPNSSSILKDIDLIHVKEKYESNKLIEKKGDVVIINTWFHTEHGHRLYQCSIEALYYNFTIIYKELGIKLEPIEYYIPSIDYSKFNISPIDEFMKSDKKYIYVSNGDVHSEQAHPESMEPLIQALSKNKNYTIILTNDLVWNTNEIHANFDDNVIMSKDIIKSDGKDDLNENSYISTKCDVVIGRESGPYSFAHVKENTSSDKKQIFIVSSYIRPFFYPSYYNENKKLYHTNNFAVNIEAIKSLL